jgi:hypothetical protein
MKLIFNFFSIFLLLISKFNYLMAKCYEFACYDDWQIRKDNDGKVYGYKAFIQESMNFFEVRIF